MIQIFIVEDHPIMRQSIRALLEREADLSVCGEADRAETAMEQFAETTPDLVLIDVSLPGMSGIEFVRTLCLHYPDLPLIMLSGHSEKNHVDQALTAGAYGYILKGSSDELLEGIRHVMRGEQYLSSEIRDPDINLG